MRRAEEDQRRGTRGKRTAGTDGDDVAPRTFREWIEWAEPIGLGELKLLPWEFWRLTPGEFVMRLEGFMRLEDRAWERTGTLGLWMLGPHRKKSAPPLTLRKLLGRTLRLWPERRHGDR